MAAALVREASQQQRRNKLSRYGSNTTGKFSYPCSCVHSLAEVDAKAKTNMA